MAIEQTDIDAVLEQVREALNKEDWKQAVALIESLRPPDQADLFGELPPEVQNELLPRLNPEDSADILEELKEEEAAQIAEQLEPEELTRILDDGARRIGRPAGRYRSRTGDRGFGTD